MDSSTTPLVSESILDHIADHLTRDGYLVLKDIIDPNLLKGLRQQALSLSDNRWRDAGIGRAASHQIDHKIRSDKIHWITGNNQAESMLLDLMDCLRIGINRRLYLGLYDYESHFSVYREGMFYHKHIDALKGRSNRVLSTVLYLNDNWQQNSGGELLIHAEKDDSVLATVSPYMGTMAIFLSEKMPHQVLPARQTRYSIAGWFSVA